MLRSGRRLALVLATLFTVAAHASDPVRIESVWPAPANGTICEIGRGVGIVFTPDLSVEGNCALYDALGFACFQSADWAAVLDGIRTHNASSAYPIRTLVLETHGTNGNGLKLQESKRADAPRSYISVGALQEHLGEAGVEQVILSACNSGRLLRPSIYRKLNRAPGDRLFLPPTLGIIDASDRFDPRRTPVRIVAPAESHIETTIIASRAELTATARHALRAIALDRGFVLPDTFAISDMLMQILLRDPSLRLRIAAPVTNLSSRASAPEESERLFGGFVRLLDRLSVRANSRALAEPVSPPATRESTD